MQERVECRGGRAASSLLDSRFSWTGERTAAGLEPSCLPEQSRVGKDGSLSRREF